MGWDYQKAEIDWRKASNRLDGPMAVVHNAAMMFPPRVLGDRELWPKLCADLESWLSTDDNERSLIPQWEACLLYDQMETLPKCEVPMHVVAFSEDVQAPPQDGGRLRRRSQPGIECPEPTITESGRISSGWKRPAASAP